MMREDNGRPTMGGRCSFVEGGCGNAKKNVQQGKPPSTRVDVRFGDGPDGKVFLLNKAMG